MDHVSKRGWGMWNRVGVGTELRVTESATQKGVLSQGEENQGLEPGELS